MGQRLLSKTFKCFLLAENYIKRAYDILVYQFKLQYTMTIMTLVIMMIVHYSPSFHQVNVYTWKSYNLIE